MSCFKKSCNWIGNTTKDLVKMADRAPAAVGFSYSGDRSYTSLTGGFFAICCFLYMAVFLIYSVIEVFSKESIIAQQKLKIDPQSSSVSIPITKGMMFAIGVQQLDMRYQKIFKLRFSRTKKFLKPRNQTQIRRMQQVKLVPCTAKIWEQLELSDFYKQYQLAQMLCPDPDQIMKLSDSRGYRLEIQQCNPESPWPANVTNYINSMNTYFQNFEKKPEWNNYYEQKYGDDTPDDGEEQDMIMQEDDTQDQNTTQITQDTSFYQDPMVTAGDVPPSYDTIPCLFDYYQKVFKLPRQYRIQFYFVNTILNPQQHQPTEKFVDYQQFLIQLTNDTILRTQADLHISSYDITTNNNLLFDKDYKIQKKRGLIKLNPIDSSVFIYSNQTNISTANTTSFTWQKMDNYFTLDFKRSSEVKYVNRKYKTIANVISQLGGFMSFFAAVLGFFLVSYNQLAIDLEFVKSIYYEDKNKKIDDIKLNYMNFIFYCIYSFFKYIGCEPNWKLFKQWDRAREGTEKILDIRNVVNKIQHLQKVGMTLLEQDKYYALYFQQPSNLTDEQQKLKASNIYQQMRQKYFPNGQLTQDALRQWKQWKQFNQMKKLQGQSSNIQINMNQAVNQSLPHTPQKNRNKNYKQQQMQADSNKVYDASTYQNLTTGKIIPQKQQIEEQDDIDSQFIEDMKRYLVKIKLEAETKNNKLAQKVYQKIDPNIKQILLNQKNLNRPKKLQAKIVNVSVQNIEETQIKDFDVQQKNIVSRRALSRNEPPKSQASKKQMKRQQSSKKDLKK